VNENSGRGRFFLPTPRTKVRKLIPSTPKSSPLYTDKESNLVYLSLFNPNGPLSNTLLKA